MSGRLMVILAVVSSAVFSGAACQMAGIFVGSPHWPRTLLNCITVGLGAGAVVHGIRTLIALERGRSQISSVSEQAAKDNR